MLPVILAVTTRVIIRTYHIASKHLSRRWIDPNPALAQVLQGPCCYSSCFKDRPSDAVIARPCPGAALRTSGIARL